MKILNHLTCVSAIALALAGMVGCTKKDDPKPQAEIDVATPKVAQHPVMVCDDIGLKNRVVSLVRDELYTASVHALGSGASEQLALQLNARLLELDIDLQNISQTASECRGQLHIVLPSQEIETANKVFGRAGVAGLEEQAIEDGISIMGGNRLVGDFVFHSDEQTLTIDNNTPVIMLASETMATAIRAMNRQNLVNAKRETANIGQEFNDIIPAPTVQIRPVELPPLPQIPTPEEAILQPEDIPSGIPQAFDSNTKLAESKMTSKMMPKTQPETTSQTQTPSKPKTKPTAEFETQKPISDEIVIIETDETY